MSLSRREVQKIAHLARLEITDEELDDYVDNLSRIVDFVQQLDAAETGGVAPMAHPLEMVQRLRPDEVSEPDVRDLAAPNAPLMEDGLYLVPRVLD